MTQPKLRVGILGAGQAGERHAIGFGTLATAEVAAVADVDPARGQALAGRFSAGVYTDWQAMVDQAKLDILVVALPHNAHVAPTEVAAAQGIHVMMEKPIATTLADGRRIVELCARAGVKLGTSFVHRYREEAQLLYGWVRSGELGQPMLARETMNIERRPNTPPWIISQEIAGGGVLMYSAIHGVDRLRWLVGSEVTHVTARTHQFEPPTEVEDGVAALLTFANGATATLMATAPAYPAQPTIWESEVVGTQGMGRLRTRQWAQLSNAAGPRHIPTTGITETEGDHYNFARQAAAFVDAILHDTEPAASGQDGLAALEIVLAVYASAAQGKTVAMSELDRVLAAQSS
jgi:predicted dehydrogenase